MHTSFRYNVSGTLWHAWGQESMQTIEIQRLFQDKGVASERQMISYMGGEEERQSSLEKGMKVEEVTGNLGIKSDEKSGLL